MIVVLTTVPEIQESEELAKSIVESKLAACVQVVPKIKSYYFWEGKVQNEDEYLLLIKTLSSNFQKLAEFIRSHHSYEVPEVVALEASDVSDSYLSWMTDYLE